MVTRARFGKRVLHLPCAHPATAGPENYQCRSTFIQIKRALDVSNLRFQTQAFVDSWHGRIAATHFKLPVDSEESRRLQSGFWFKAHPLHWLTTALEIHCDLG